MSAVPTQIGKYRVLERLGQGSMGVVYLAEDPDIRRRIALKTLHHSPMLGGLDTAQALARFRNEAQAAGRLQHPNIVAVYEYGLDGSTAYLAMEYVEGHALSRYLGADQAPMAPQHVREVMRQLLDALEHAHRQGVWHRDIKPSNLMFNRQGQLKVTDFGIARLEGQDLTQVGAVLGTPHCMAPEQFIGEACDHRVDLWAAGVLLYQMLTGRQPFQGRADTVMYQVLHVTPVPPSELAPLGHSGWDDAVVLKALARRPQDRYADAAAFREALFPVNPAPPEATEANAEAADATRLQPLWQRPVSPTPGTSAAPVTGAVPAATTWGSTPPLPTGWDESALLRIEAALREHLGPVTRVLVRRAARECRDETVLLQRLNQHIADEATRQGLTQVINTLSRTPTGTLPTANTPPSTSPAPPDPPNAAPVPPQEADLLHAERTLAPHLGPIARVLVRRAAQGGVSRDVFWQRLLERVADLPQHAQIAQALRQPPP